MRKFILVLTAFLGLSSAAQAGLMLEPYIGYEMGGGKATYTSDATQSYTNKATGSTVGARVGYKLPLMFWLAADYSMTSGSDKYEYVNSALNDSPSYNRTSLYATVGMDFIVLVRGYVGYSLSNENKVKFNTGEATAKGSAYKVGVGFTGLPFVSINAEYVKYTYTDLSGSNGSAKVSDLYSSFDNSAFMLGVSVPFNL